jgi:hypothetical protein
LHLAPIHKPIVSNNKEHAHGTFEPTSTPIQEHLVFTRPHTLANKPLHLTTNNMHMASLNQLAHPSKNT